MMTMRRIFVAGLLIPPWALFLLCCYWYFIDVAPAAEHTRVAVLDVFGAPVTSVQRGAKVIISRDLCVTDEGKAFFTRTLVLRAKGLVYFIPSGEMYLIKGCRRSFNEITIPSHIEPGLYDYVVTMTFVNNPLVDTRMVLPIPSFEVTP
jgi:hypothetical protein